MKSADNPTPVIVSMVFQVQTESENMMFVVNAVEPDADVSGEWIM